MKPAETGQKTWTKMTLCTVLTLATVGRHIVAAASCRTDPLAVAIRGLPPP